MRSTTALMLLLIAPASGWLAVHRGRARGDRSAVRAGQFGTRSAAADRHRHPRRLLRRRTQAVGHLSVAFALGRLPVSRTSIALLGPAPLTAVLAVPLLGERLTMVQFAGGALVLARIFVVNRMPRARAVEPEPLIE